MPFTTALIEAAGNSDIEALLARMLPSAGDAEGREIFRRAMLPVADQVLAMTPSHVMLVMAMTTLQYGDEDTAESRAKLHANEPKRDFLAPAMFSDDFITLADRVRKYWTEDCEVEGAKFDALADMPFDTILALTNVVSVQGPYSVVAALTSKQLATFPGEFINALGNAYGMYESTRVTAALDTLLGDVDRGDVSFDADNMIRGMQSIMGIDVVDG